MKFFKENCCVFVLKGKDVLDFLQRVTTNDITALSFNSSIRTVFLNEKGRIIDFVILLRRKDDVLMISTYENSDKLKNHLDKYIVLDDVSYSLNIIGKITFIPENEEKFHQNKGVNLIENNYFIADNYRFNKIIGLELNKNSEYCDKLKSNSKQLSEAEFLELTIENEYICFENELNERVNPFDCNLHEFLSFSKGCYIGQEVIARLDSQGKKINELVKISSGNKLSSGDKIYSIFEGNEIECGFISSTVQLNNKFLAFGFIRQAYLNFDHIYYINKSNTEIISINKFN